MNDVIEIFIDDCHAAMPCGSSLRVFDRRGGRRILRGEADVTKPAGRVIYFTVPPNEQRDVWHAEPKELVRRIALGLYGDGDALSCGR